MKEPTGYGTLYGLGLGPGDRDLMTVRADRLLRAARHVAFFRKAGRPGHARQIVTELLAEGVREHPLEYPVTTEIPFDSPDYKSLLADFYADCCDRLRSLAETGEDVVVLCEGDPFFYGSFMHLYMRLKDSLPIQVVPAITGMSAAWTATGIPMTWGDDVMTVLPGTLPESELAQHMTKSDALVVMKVGRNLPRIRRALAAAGRLDAAWLVENASMTEQRVVKLNEAEQQSAPYFSIVLVHGQGRRP